MTVGAVCLRWPWTEPHLEPWAADDAELRADGSTSATACVDSEPSFFLDPVVILGRSVHRCAACRC